MRIERNYRKNPHTANFLMTFHTAGGTNLGGAVAEASRDEDLLNLVPDAPADLRTPGQRQFMDDLIGRITRLDAELGAQAREWTDKATAAGDYWTAQRGGTASQWIDRLINKERELKAATSVQPVAPVIGVADGRYAVEEDGALKFFRVKNGRKPGFVFLDIQASDDWFPIRVASRRADILAEIAKDPHAAMIRYGHELGECGRCGRTLTDEASREAGIGPICASK